MTNIYVGNLPYRTTEDDLAEAFTGFGTVERTTIVIDRETGRSRGFGFVEMPDDAAALKAIEHWNGNPFNGRPLTVNVARPRGSGKSDGGGNASVTAASKPGGDTPADDSTGYGPSSSPSQPVEEVPASRGYSNQILGKKSTSDPMTDWREVNHDGDDAEHDDSASDSGAVDAGIDPADDGDDPEPTATSSYGRD
jgi:RNA recognition motif-containing protein